MDYNAKSCDVVMWKNLQLSANLTTNFERSIQSFIVKTFCIYRHKNIYVFTLRTDTVMYNQIHSINECFKYLTLQLLKIR